MGERPITTYFNQNSDLSNPYISKKPQKLVKDPKPKTIKITKYGLNLSDEQFFNLLEKCNDHFDAKDF